MTKDLRERVKEELFGGFPYDNHEFEVILAVIESQLLNQREKDAKIVEKEITEHFRSVIDPVINKALSSAAEKIRKQGV